MHGQMGLPAADSMHISRNLQDPGPHRHGIHAYLAILAKTGGGCVGWPQTRAIPSVAEGLRCRGQLAFVTCAAATDVRESAPKKRKGTSFNRPPRAVSAALPIPERIVLRAGTCLGSRESVSGLHRAPDITGQLTPIRGHARSSTAEMGEASSRTSYPGLAKYCFLTGR